MTAPITAAGFFGTVDEIAESKRMGLIGPPFRTASVTDWAPSADAGINRRVNITAGQAAAYGVLGTTAAAQSVTFAANTGSVNRYDALVATFAWAANAGIGVAARSITYRAITGSTIPPTVNATSSVDNTKINRIKGAQYDALVAVVRVRPSVGLLSSGDVADVRMWGGYEGDALSGTAQYLTLLDTYPGSRVRAVDSDIVWHRYGAAGWGFDQFVGTDKTKQPMISLRRTAMTMPQSTSFTTIGGWPEVADHGTQGSVPLLTLNSSGQVVCQVPGRVRIDAYAYSDLGDAGMAEAFVDFPAGGGNYITSLDDGRQRATGYATSGLLRQNFSGGPLPVLAGDVIGLNARQMSASGITCNFDFALSVTYV